MCGLAGLLVHDGRSRGELARAAERMAATLSHRGPDDGGSWADATAGVALAFRRLAILDLSEAGHQPMRSASGRYTIVFNGEVYNYRELRSELERGGCRFRGHSDTEVILAGLDLWGLEAAVRRFIGMFAIAVWDAEQRSLSLVRDRLGVKPLFVYARPGLVSFGSELKALLAGPSFDRTLDRDALTAYLRYLYIPAPRTIYRHASKLLPGHILTLTDPGEPLPEARPYWSAEGAARRGLADLFAGSETEATAELERLLRDAVGLRTRADVPLGALLSGGVDSSTVAALARASVSRPLRTFSIGFEEAEYDEAAHAARVAGHLGTDHTELTVTGADAIETVPRLAELFDEPLADTSQLPAFLVCTLARRGITVALSGDGGDEVFGGYNRYTYGERILERARLVPRPARQLLAAGLGRVSPDSWRRAHRAVAPVLPPALRHRLPGTKLSKIGRLLAADTLPGMYRSLVSAWQQPDLLVIGGHEPAGAMERVLGASEPARFFDRMLLADQLTYMVDDQLAKVDRVSMAVGLEVRVPLVDHRVVEFAWRLPPALKARAGTGKWLLRQVLYRHVPRELVERPKMGFSVPIDRWLRGPLRTWAEDLLAADRIERDGILRSAPVRRAWQDLLAGRGDAALGLWAVLVFQAWNERWLS